MFDVLRLLLWILYKIFTMTFESAIVIILTALAVMLAVLAIGIAVLAILGYAGFKEIVRDAAVKQVAGAMAAKLKEYPQAAEMAELVTQLKAQSALMNQIGTSPATGTAIAASKPVPETTVETYPGEEPPNVSNTPTTGASGPQPETDAGPNNRKTPDDRSS